MAAVRDRTRTYPPGALVVVGGVPGSGKTTLLRRVAVDGTATVLDSDDMRRRAQSALGTTRGYGLYRPVVHALHWLSIARALRRPGGVVVHETATRTASRLLLATAARLRGREAHAIFLDVGPRAARAGQTARDRRVGDRAMRRHVRRWTLLRGRLAGGPPRGFTSAVVLSRRTAGSLRVLRFAGADEPAAPAA
jgi:predicted kinase